MPPTSSLLFALALCAACGADAATPDAALDAAPVDTRALDAPPIDARTGPLRCLGDAPPATAPDPIAVGGNLVAVVAYQTTAVAGATVELRRATDGGVIATATTASDGTFTISAPTGGHPLDAWLSVATAGHLPTRAHFGEPLIGGEHALVIVAGAAEVGAWYADAGATYAAGARTLITSVKDCDDASTDLVTATLAPATRTTYYDSDAGRWDPALASAPNGFVLASGAPASLTITPSIDATALPPRTLALTADALTLLVATPRSP